jgi:hypothetical protein
MTSKFARCVSCALAGLPACGGTGPVTSTSSCDGASADALWVATDYASSSFGGLALSGGVLSDATGVDLGADPALAISRGRGFFVARDQSAIVEIDPRCGTPVSRLHVPPPPGTNGALDPYDVGVARDGSLWVPLFDVPALVVMSASGGLVRALDLSSYDTDGNPNASAVAMVDTTLGEKAFVVLERLDDSNGYAVDKPAWMLRIDVATSAIEGYVELAGRNPFGPIVAEGGVLWLADPGSWFDANEADAGIERFDPETNTTALVVSEVNLGGSVAEVAVSGTCAVAIVADPTSVNATSLVTVDLASGDVRSPVANSPLSTAGYDLEGLEVVGGDVMVGDRRRAASGYPVHVFDMDDACDLAPSDTLTLAQPPVAIRQPR